MIIREINYIERNHLIDTLSDNNAKYIKQWPYFLRKKRNLIYLY